ncbi:Uncharacterised protein [Cronobacter sakazakii]|nr:Uncharacterised protein [Cronobacter sakazakii]
MSLSNVMKNTWKNSREAVPEFIEKMDMALAEIGFTFGEQWR